VNSERGWIKAFRLFSLSMAGVFIIVGGIFLFGPRFVYTFFNDVSLRLNLTPAPEVGANFFLILTSAYMYVVALLAFFIYRHPQEKRLSLLLCQAKLFSALVSLGFWLLLQPFLMYLTNAIVDGSIGAIYGLAYLQLRRLDS
jgi:hypothetical protein